MAGPGDANHLPLEGVEVAQAEGFPFTRPYDPFRDLVAPGRSSGRELMKELHPARLYQEVMNQDMASVIAADRRVVWYPLRLSKARGGDHIQGYAASMAWRCDPSASLCTADADPLALLVKPGHGYYILNEIDLLHKTPCNRYL